jgi:putative copper export protein
VLPRAKGVHGEHRLRIAARVAQGGVAAGLVLILAQILELCLEAAVVRGGTATMGGIRMVTMQTHWGGAWWIQLLSAGLAVCGLLVAMRGRASGWAIAGVAAVGLALGSSLLGHAGAADRLRTLAVVDDSLHVLSASAWLGSLLWLMLAALGRNGVSAREVNVRTRALVNAFSPLALTCAAIVVITGIISAWLRLESLAALWSSTYGQVLMAKIVALIAVLAAGSYNWKVAQPALGTARGDSPFRQAATAELVSGLVVLVVTAILVATPPPGSGY